MKSELKDVHAAADFYEPRMTVAFVRGMEKLQSQIKMMRLADQIAMKQRVLLPVGGVEKALADVVMAAKNAGLRGVEIGRQKLEEIK